MITYRKQVSPDSTTPANTSGYVIYQLDLNAAGGGAKMADVEIITSLSTNPLTPLNISTIYYRKLQIINDLVDPSYVGFLLGNSSFTFVTPTTPTNLYLSEISYQQTNPNRNKIQIKTTNPTGANQVGTCFVHFKINFY
jgi:hypothetical protein